MKIIEHIESAQSTLFSFEILPPLKGASFNELLAGMDPLMEFKPSFIDVTYHREDYVLKKRADGTYDRISTKKDPEPLPFAQPCKTTTKLMQYPT